MPLASRIFHDGLALLLSGCALTACATPSAGRDTGGPLPALSVRELTIVDEHGQPRLRLGAPLPSPKGLERAVTAYGIQFMDPSGHEIGGLAMLDAINFRGLCFDSEEGYEAMCMSLMKGKPNITFRHDWKERIVIGVEENGAASVVLHDAQGNPHLRLEVSKDGQTRVEGVTPAPASR